MTVMRVRWTKRLLISMRITGAALLALIVVSAWASWYSQRVSLRRYCGDSEPALESLRLILREETPSTDTDRRARLAGARLLFLRR